VTFVPLISVWRFLRLSRKLLQHQCAGNLRESGYLHVQFCSTRESLISDLSCDNVVKKLSLFCEPTKYIQLIIAFPKIKKAIISDSYRALQMAFPKPEKC
jgi:hypothetical protein